MTTAGGNGKAPTTFAALRAWEQWYDSHRKHTYLSANKDDGIDVNDASSSLTLSIKTEVWLRRLLFAKTETAAKYCREQMTIASKRESHANSGKTKR